MSAPKKPTYDPKKVKSQRTTTNLWKMTLVGMITATAITASETTSAEEEMPLELEAPVPTITIEEDGGKTVFGPEGTNAVPATAEAEAATETESMGEIPAPSLDEAPENSSAPKMEEETLVVTKEEEEEGDVDLQAAKLKGPGTESGAAGETTGWDDWGGEAPKPSADGGTNVASVEATPAKAPETAREQPVAPPVEPKVATEEEVAKAIEEKKPVVKEAQPMEETITAGTNAITSAPNTEMAATPAPTGKAPDANEEEIPTITQAPQPPSAPEPPVTSPLDGMEPPSLSSSTESTEQSPTKDPSLDDLRTTKLPETSEVEGREIEVTRLIRQLEQEAVSKEVARSVAVPNQMQEEINFDKVPLSAAFRLLAEQAGFNFIEPNFPEGETLSLRLQKVRPLDAFMKIAEAKGFAVVTENGYTTLKRPDITSPAFMEVKKYRLRFIQPKWILQSVANLLEIKLERPEDVISSFPEPNEDATSYGGANGGNTGGGGGSVGGGGGSTGGSQNIGLPTAPRWTPSLPYDEPSFTGEGSDEVPYIFVDRGTTSIVVKTTKEKQKMVAQFLSTVDKPEPQVLIETRVVETTLSELMKYGTDWQQALDQGITIKAAGFNMDLINSMASGGTWSLFLTVPETEVTIRAFQEMGNGSVVNMPRTMTRSGVPVAISSTITDATPSYQLSTGTGDSGATSTPSGFNTFTTGMVIDVVPQVLENGMIDININPTVANKIGEQKIPATDSTPEQNIPIISSRSITTSAIIPSGMTIMLGGLTEQVKTDNSAGIPILSKIPLVGKTVFGNTDRNDARKTLIVFVTPKLIYPDQYEKVWTNEEEWRAMIDSNRIGLETETAPIPNTHEIRRAIPLHETMAVKPGKKKARRSSQ
jgi:Flp pilus assembly secretin CpaC